MEEESKRKEERLRGERGEGRGEVVVGSHRVPGGGETPSHKRETLGLQRP